MTMPDPIKKDYSRYRVLGIFPHPDDEAYAASGTFTKLSAAGAQVKLVCATDGEAGMHRANPKIRGKALGRVRREELRKSAKCIGADLVEFLGLPDGGLAGVGEPELSSLIQKELRTFHPHLVVTLGDDGVYGHIDHVTLTRAVSQAFAESEFSKIRLMHCAFPRGLFAPTYKMLRKRAGYILHESVSLDALGAQRENCEVVVELDEEKQSKLASIEAHASQLLEARAATFLLPGLKEHLLLEEWFQWIAGPGFSGKGAGLLEGLSC